MFASTPREPNADDRSPPSWWASGPEMWATASVFGYSCTGSTLAKCSAKMFIVDRQQAQHFPRAHTFRKRWRKTAIQSLLTQQKSLHHTGSDELPHRRSPPGAPPPCQRTIGIAGRLYRARLKPCCLSTAHRNQPASVLAKYAARRFIRQARSRRAPQIPTAAAAIAVAQTTAAQMPNWTGVSRCPGAFTERASCTPGLRMATPINGT